MKKYLAAAALALATTMAAAPAQAATTINFLDLGTTQIAAFGNLNPASTFTDEYTFTIPAGSLDGFLGSIGLSFAGTNLEFASILLNGQNVFTVGSDSGLLETRNLSNFLVNAGPQTLVVSGTAQRFATYGGTFTLTEAAVGAVPEPATWAMMLLGFGAVGYSMRRRKVSYKLAQVA